MPRLFGWGIVALVLVLALAWLAPQQLPVVAYKLALVTIAVVLAYWLDRALFPYARPHVMFRCATDYQQSPDREERIRGSSVRWSANIAMLRRALIVIACVLGLTMGL
ncbi:MAG: hypothetical protein HLX50_06575 [Alteromonadaceae bacterium]|nr:hypothetical protein [Alteromonadaceae bacterium]